MHQGTGCALDSAALVQLQALSYQYSNGREVLNGLNLSLHPQQRLGISGDNGSGKTTLLQVILGLLPVSCGSIRIFGQIRRTEADFAAIRTQLGLVFQDVDDQLFCPTVAEDVAFGPLNQGKTRAQAQQISKAILAQLGLAGYETRLTHQLSGGEKRLVALATVLAMQPQALLLDEPTTGLDKQARQRLLQHLQALPQAMIVVSHDEAFLAQLVQQRFELVQGQLQPLR